MTTEQKQILLRRDTTSNLSGIVPAEGELVYDTTRKKAAIGDGVTQRQNADEFALDSEVLHAKKLADRLYSGVDLSVKFAAEITNYSDVWAWIKSRISVGNYEGIHVGDYIPFQLAAGTVTDGTTTYTITAKTMHAQIAGIDTYYGYGYVEHEGSSVHGHHIDFITTKTIGTNIPWNPTDNNNGTADHTVAWLASKLYACLNGVNNYSTQAYNNVPHGFATQPGKGVINLLPQALQNQIVEKTLACGNRYSASGLLTVCSGWAGYWGIGKLWVPTEIEVYGAPIHSTEKAADGRDYNNIGAPVQYPLFANTNGYTHNLNKGRVYWWLLSTCGGSSSHACSVDGSGNAVAPGCATTNISAPVCFRI